MSDHPFTDMEIYEALRLIGVPEDEAWTAARETVDPSPAPAANPRRSAESRHAKELEFFNEPSIQFHGDMLAALSLVSDSTFRKVQRFRSLLRGADQPDPEEERAWRERRDEFQRRLGPPDR